MKSPLFLVLLLTLVAPPAFAAKMVSVTVGTAALYDSPNPSRYNLALEMPLFYPLEVINQQGDYLEVMDYRQRIGWVAREEIGEAPCVVMMVGQGNIRKSPDTSAELLFRAEQGVTFKVLKKQGEWYQLRHESGAEGWGHENLFWGAN